MVIVLALRLLNIFSSTLKPNIMYFALLVRFTSCMATFVASLP